MSHYWEQPTQYFTSWLISSVVLTNTHCCETFSTCPNCYRLLVLTNEFWKALKHDFKASLPSSVWVCGSTNPSWSNWGRGTRAGADAEAIFPYFHSFFLINLPQTILTMQKLKLNFSVMGCYLFHFTQNENLGSLEEQLSNFVPSGEATSVHLLLFMRCRQKPGGSFSALFLWLWELGLSISLYRETTKQPLSRQNCNNLLYLESSGEIFFIV